MGRCLVCRCTGPALSRGLAPPARLEVDCVLGVATADGTLAESLPATITAAALGEASAAVVFASATFAGTLRVTLPDPSFSVSVNLTLALAGGGATGEMMVSGTKQEGNVGQGVGVGLPIAELTTTRAP